MSDSVKKTGIFGGAFNPVHNGHVRLAEEAVKQLKLRRLLIIPTYVSPHKHTDLAPYEDRAEMCRRAFGHIPGVEVSDIEVRLGGTSYSINTVRALGALYSGNSMSRSFASCLRSPKCSSNATNSATTMPITYME